MVYEDEIPALDAKRTQTQSLRASALGGLMGGPPSHAAPRVGGGSTGSS